MQRRTCIVVAFLVGFAVTLGAVEIRPAEVADGMVTNWSAADWVTLDTVYHADGEIGVYNAEWAALWTPDRIFVRIKATDSDPVFTEGNTGWNTSDRVEIYVDAGNKMPVGYNADYALAQQFVIGPIDTDTQWVTLGAAEDGAPHLGSVATAVAHIGSESILVYQVELIPYDNFVDGTTVTLEAGMEIGLEVIVDSANSDGSFCMISGGGMPTMGGKFQNGAAIDRVMVVD